MSIIISQDGKNAVRLQRTIIEKEDYLQQYIYDNPESLPLHELKEDIHLLILSREFPTSSGPIDALGVDADGDLYIIETKLYKNADKRRVLAQMLDYGAALWSAYGNSGHEFIGKLEEVALANHAAGLAQRLNETFGFEDESLTEYLGKLEQSLSQGNFRFIVLMDQLDKRLKDLITFVNTNSRFDILGVELDFYKHQQFEIIIPNLYGAERKKEVAVSSRTSSRANCNEMSFLEQVDEKLGTRKEPMLILYQWFKAKADIVQFGKGNTCSINPMFEHLHERYAIFSVFSNGDLHLKFRRFQNSPAAQSYLIELGENLRRKAQFNLPDNFLEVTKVFSIDQWGHKVDTLLEVFEESLWPSRD
jgi:uncharacterized protein (DUF736 family)